MNEFGVRVPRYLLLISSLSLFSFILLSSITRYFSNKDTIFFDLITLIYFILSLVIYLVFARPFIKEFEFKKQNIFSTSSVIIFLVLLQLLSFLFNTFIPSDSIRSYNLILVISTSLFIFILYYYFKERFLAEISKSTYLHKFWQSNYRKISAPNQEINVNKNELIEGDTIILNQGELVPANSYIFKGEGIFKTYTYPLKMQTSYLKSEECVPFGSVLKYGQCLCQILPFIENSKTENTKIFFEKILKKIRSKSVSKRLQSHIALIFAVLLLFVILYSTSNLTMSELLYYSSVALSFVLMIDFTNLDYFYKIHIIDRLFRKGIILNKFDQITELLSYNKYKILKKDRDFEFVNVQETILYSQSLDQDRIKLIIFYLISDTNNKYLSAIKEKIVKSIKDFKHNPLEEKILEDDTGISAKLEGANILFGEEDFIISKGVVINTSEIFRSSPNSITFYLAIEKEVFAAIEIIVDTNCISVLSNELNKYNLKLIDERSEKENVSLVDKNYKSNLVPKDTDLLKNINQTDYIEIVLDQNVKGFEVMPEDPPRIIFSSLNSQDITLPFRKAHDFNSFVFISRTSLILALLFFVFLITSNVIVALLFIGVIAIYSLYRQHKILLY